LSSHGHGAYSGLWIENVVSGIARDLLAEAMLRIEAAGYPIILHVHDEIVAEVPHRSGRSEEFIRLMTRRPT
jgi:DNA polymerase bacteriophage-type